MISERDLLEAIMETEDEPPSYASIKKLANLYIVYDHLFSTKPVSNNIDTTTDSEFLRTAKKKDIDKVLNIIDELMQTLEIVNNKVYQSVIKKIKEL